MPTSDRHHAALNAATDTYRATAIGASALPRLSTRTLDAERARTARELDRLIGERGVLQSSIDGAQLDRAAARSAMDSARAAAALVRERRVDLTTQVDASGERTTIVEQRRTALAVSLSEVEQRADAIQQIHDRIEVALTKVADHSLTPEQIRSTADELERLAGRATDADVDAATALRDWSMALRNGTAPLRPSTAALLTGLGDLERRWNDHGRGDLLADPAVAAVRSTLDRERTVQAEIEDQASAGALGERTMRTIREANSHRAELEDRGNKADAGKLRSAIEAETEALHLVGFDSMLDLHIAMSTGGTGTLVEARRTTVALRVAELESELAMLLATTVALHADLQVRFDELQSQADVLLGGVSGRPLDESLRGMLAIPEPVRHARAGLDQMLQMVGADVASQRRELDDLTAERSALDLRGAVARARELEADADLEQAEQVCEASSATLAQWLQSLDDLRQQWNEADEQVTATAGDADALANCGYLEDDRRELSRAITAALVEHAIWLSSGAGSLHGAPAIAMVVDDPLHELEDADAGLVIDEMVATTWPLPVVYVTSRPSLVQRLRQDAGHLVCIDGRRKPRTSHRWSKRNEQDESIRR